MPSSESAASKAYAAQLETDALLATLPAECRDAVRAHIAKILRGAAADLQHFIALQQWRLKWNIPLMENLNTTCTVDNTVNGALMACLELLGGELAKAAADFENTEVVQLSNLRASAFAVLGSLGALRTKLEAATEGIEPLQALQQRTVDACKELVQIMDRQGASEQGA